MKKLIIESPKHGTKELLLDDSDYERLKVFNWFVTKTKNTFYARRCVDYINKKQLRTSAHRDVFNLSREDKVIVDHIDRNGLNCQRQNLRICNHDQNKRNRSKMDGTSSVYMGVHLRSRKMSNNRIYKVWAAGIYSRMVSESKKNFPYTPEGEIEAAKYYDVLAKKHYGEFANLNFKD